MPEEAYDLFSGQYVQVPTEAEEAAMKSIYKHELPVREKFRGRAQQANQPGDQPWKGKRK